MITFSTAFVIAAMSYQVSVTKHTPLRKSHTMGMFIIAVLADVLIGLNG